MCDSDYNSTFIHPYKNRLNETKSYCYKKIQGADGAEENKRTPRDR